MILREWRDRLCITQAHAAALLKVSTGGYAMAERGDAGHAPSSMMLELARMIEVYERPVLVNGSTARTAARPRRSAIA